MSDINQNSNHYLSFKLSDETFAVEVAKIFEILEIPQITKVPSSPKYMTGVINLRGNVLPVIDTRLKFNMTQSEYTVNSCIIVFQINANGDNMTLGALVDSVQEVLEIESTAIKPSPSLGNNYRAGFIEGMVNVKDQFVMILNIDDVLTSEDINIIQESLV